MGPVPIGSIGLVTMGMGTAVGPPVGKTGTVSVYSPPVGMGNGGPIGIDRVGSPLGRSLWLLSSRE